MTPITREERARWSMWNADHVEGSEAQRVSEADICRLLAALDAADALMAAGARLDIWATTVHTRGADVQFNDMENLGRAIDVWRRRFDAYRAIVAPASAERRDAAPEAAP